MARGDRSLRDLPMERHRTSFEDRRHLPVGNSKPVEATRTL